MQCAESFPIAVKPEQPHPTRHVRMSGWAAAPVRRFPGGAKELLMENRFEVAVGAGTMRAASSPALCFPHRWTPEGVTVEADFTGGHLHWRSVEGRVASVISGSGARVS